MILKLKNGFSRMSDAELETRASQIVAAMTRNPNFVKPTPTVEVVQEIATAYSVALTNCADGDHLKIAVKNQKRGTLIDTLHQWVYYVLLTAKGDEAIAISSGYRIGKTPSPAPPLTKPDAPTLESGINPGELLCIGKPVSGAVSYLHQYATELMMAQNNWQSVPCSKSSCVITNLLPGTKYFCRIAVVGRKEQLVYSDIVNRIAA